MADYSELKGHDPAAEEALRVADGEPADPGDELRGAAAEESI